MTRKEMILDGRLVVLYVGFNGGIPVLNPPTSVSSFPMINPLPNDIRGINIGVISTGVGDDSIPTAQSPSIVADQP